MVPGAGGEGGEGYDVALAARPVEGAGVGAWRIDVGVVALVKAAASAVVLATGFTAVSDDDFARVVIAQEWAHAPKLDPSGTSWLPFPFWVLGLVMKVFGRGLGVARATAIALGILSAVLVYVAARWITEERGAALAGALLSAVFPWSATLGVAMVPELPAAALVLFAAASTVPVREGDRARSVPWRRLWGGAALVLATLSRYEAWPVAAAFAALSVFDAVRAPREPGPLEGRRWGARVMLVLAAALALVGPLAWIAWNRFAHGDALHFLERVAAYRKALGGGADKGVWSALFAYPLALARHEPELLGAWLLLGLCAVLWRMRPASVAVRGARYARPAALALAQVALLSAAMVRDGAPTHHPERALLSAMLLLAIACGDLGLRIARYAPIRVRVAAALLLAAWILPAAIFFRRWMRAEDFAKRGDELAIGSAAARVVHPGERILVEVVDYGYFAIMAALSRPEDVELDRSVDPRLGTARGSFGDRGALARRIAESGVSYVIGRVSSASSWAAPAHASVVQGEWALWRAVDVSSARPARAEGASP